MVLYPLWIQRIYLLLAANWQQLKEKPLLRVTSREASRPPASQMPRSPSFPVAAATRGDRKGWETTNPRRDRKRDSRKKIKSLNERSFFHLTNCWHYITLAFRR
jgi:hypothetical protein